MSTEDNENCSLIGGMYANLLQFVLAVAALSGLLFKRMQEMPKRPFKVWIYDISKQGYGALFVHFWNIVMSILLSDMAKNHNSGEVDACALYFVQFFLDMMLGMFIIWVMIRLQESLALRLNIPSLLISGDYGTPPKQSWFWHQLGAYMFSLLVVKSIISILVLIEDNLLSQISTWIFSPVAKYPEIELTIVMIICPWVLNGLQFWIMDNILMKTQSVSPSSNTLKLGKYNFIRHGSIELESPQGNINELNIPREPSWMFSGGQADPRVADIEHSFPQTVHPNSHTLV